MLKKKKSLTIILSVMLLTSLLYILFTLNKLSSYNSSLITKSQKGTLDLSTWDFHRNGYTSLSGQWEFYGHQLLTPKELATKPSIPLYMEIPTTFREYDKYYDSNGYATFSLTIKLNSKYKNTLLGMRVPDLHSPYKLWVNGNLFSSNGVVGSDNAYRLPNTAPITNYFISNGEELHLVLQISNYNFKVKSTIDNFYLGTASEMNNKKEASIALEIFCFSALLIMGLYYLYMYIFNADNASNFYFAALYIIMSFRVILISNTYFLDLYNYLSYSFLLRSELISLYVVGYLIIGQTYAIFKENFSKKIVGKLKSFCCFLIIITILLPTQFVSWILIIFEIFTLLTLLSVIITMFIEYRRKKQRALIGKIGYITVMVISTTSPHYYLDLHSSKYYTLLGFFIILLLNTFILAIYQSNDYKNFQRLSDEKDQYLLLKKLSEVGFLLNSTLNLEEVLDKLLISLKDLVPYDSAAFFTEEDGYFNIMIGSGYRNMENLYKISINKDNDPLFKEIYETHTTLIVCDVKSDPRFRYYDNKNIIESWMGIPIIFKNKIIGILSLDSSKKNIYTQHHCDIALAFASQAGMAIENAELYGRTKKLASIDPLTNLYNRRSFFELANLSFDKAKALVQPISAIMIDVDDFKKINDKLGHHIGDLVLTRLSKVCAESLSNKHILGRYGGEEFIALLPNTTFEEAEVIAENLRTSIDSNPIIIRKSDSILITSSFGVASITPTTEDLEYLFVAADKAMYQAKSLGKNKVMSINLDL